MSRCCPLPGAEGLGHAGRPGGIAYDLRQGLLPWPFATARSVLDAPGDDGSGVEVPATRVADGEAPELALWLRETAVKVRALGDLASAAALEAAADRVEVSSAS